MKKPVFISMLRGFSVLILCCSLPIQAGTPPPDVASHSQIQQALEAASEPLDGKILSAGSWFGDVFVLPYLPGDSYDCFVGGNLNVQPRRWVAQSFLEDNSDNYDFLLVLTGFEFGSEDGVSGFYWEIQNDVQGIGIQQFDLSLQFGSDTLQGYIDGGSLSHYVLEDGSLDSNRASVVLNHELAHRWSARCSYRDDDGGHSSALLGLNDAHWSYLLDSDASFLYGSDWTDHHDGTFTATDVLSGFSDLDLYLMGLVGPESVEPFWLLENPAVPSEGFPQLGDLISATPRAVTIDQIIAAEGPRTPAFSDSPKESRIAVIYLVDPGTQVTANEIASIQEICSSWRQSFFQKSGGRAVVEVGMAGSPPVSTSDVDLQAARIWLEAAVSGGLWRDSQSTTVRDTSESLNALARFASASSTVIDGLGALSLIQVGSTELKGRQAESLALNGAPDLGSVLVESLFQNHDPTGGWGAFDRYSPDVVTSARILRALHAVEGGFSAEEATWDWIAAQQNSDGGWAWRPGGPSAVYPTLEALQAGVRARSPGDLAAVVLDAANWLLQQIRSDGGVGEPYSGVLETALFVQVAPHIPIDQSRINNAISFLAQRQQGNGSWGGRTSTTAAAITALSPFFMADPWVVADEIFAAPSTPFEGDELTLQGAVHNHGGSLPAGAEYRWELVDSSQPDLLWASFSGVLAEISAGSWAVVQDSWIPGVPAGNYLLHLIVDPNNGIDDADPSNNTATIALEIKAHAEGVDLSFAAGSPIVSPESVSSVPQVATVSGTVFNLGLTPAIGATVTVFDGDPADGVLLASQTVDVGHLALAPFAVQVVLVEPRAYALTIVLDPDDVFHDENRFNNSVQLLLGLDSTFDPGVVPGTFAAVPGLVSAGEPVILTATLQNRGTEAIGGMQLALTYEMGNPPTRFPIILQEISEPLGPGATRAIDALWRPPVSGSPISLRIEVDPNGLIEDRDLSNNFEETTISVTASDLTNLVVSPEGLTFDPGQPLQGGVVDFIGQITNNSTISSGAFTAQIRFDDEISGPVVADSTFATLDPGQTVTVSGTWAVDGPEDRLIFLLTDSGNQVEEFDEQDNLAFRVLDVVALPDLIVSQGAIEVSPGFPYSGQDVRVDVSVQNSGDQPSEPTVVEIVDGQGDFLGSTVLPEVAPHESVSVSIDWQAPESTGEISLHIRVNPAQAFAEQSYANNNSVVILAVQDANFHLSNSFLSPNGDGVMDSVVLYSRNLLNPVIVEDLEGHQVRTLSPENDAVSVVWDGLSDDGFVVADGVYRMRADANVSTVIVDTDRLTLTDNPSGVQIQQILQGVPGGDIGYLLGGTLSPSDSGIYLLKQRPDNSRELVRFAWGSLESVGEWPDGLHAPRQVNSHGDLFTAVDLYELTLVRYPGPVVEPRIWRSGFSSPSLTPDGLWIVWVGVDADELFFEAVDDSSVTFSVPPFGDPEIFALSSGRFFWSPDGSLGVLIPILMDWAEPYYLLIEPGEPPSVRVVIPESGDWPFGYGDSKIVPKSEHVVSGELSVDFFKRQITYLAQELPHDDDDGGGGGGGRGGGKSAGDRVTVYDLESGVVLSELTVPSSFPGELTVEGLSNGGRGYLFKTGDGPETATWLGNLSTGTIGRLAQPPGFEPVTREWSAFDRTVYMRASEGLVAVTTGENLTVDLKPQVLFGNAGIGLSVVATDRNFNNFTIAYAYAEAPSDFSAIGGPIREPALGENLGAWLPPAKGRYLLRLEASDRAGNRRSMTKTVNWNGDNDIANLALDGRYISPFSSPGVKDTLQFDYLVLRPANLVFKIKDDSGRVVKTVAVAAPDVGSQSVGWDGLDLAGSPVPDGRYFLSYLDAVWPFVIDNTPPELVLDIGLSMMRPGSEATMNGRVTSIHAAVFDENQDQWQFDWRPNGDTSQWNTLDYSIGNLAPEGFSFSQVASGFFVNKDVRLTATDLAGNTSEAVRTQRDETLSLAESEPLCLVVGGAMTRCSVDERPPIESVEDRGESLIDDDGKRLVFYPDFTTLVVQSTVWADVGNEIYLEYRPVSLGGLPPREWSVGDISIDPATISRPVTFSEEILFDGEVTEVPRAVDVQLIALYWEHPDLPTAAYEIRPVMINRDGLEVFGPEVRLDPPRALVLEVGDIDENGLHFRVTNTGIQTLNNIEIQDHSRAQVAPWRTLDQVSVILDPGEFVDGTLGCATLMLPAFPELRAMAFPGQIYSNSAIVEGPFERPQIVPRSQPTSCLNGQSTAAGIFLREGITFPSDGGDIFATSEPAQVDVLVSEEDPAGVPLLAYELTVDGLTSARIENPVGPIPTTTVMDLSGLAPGSHVIGERYQYQAGSQGLLEQCQRTWNLTIDSTNPTVEINSPFDGSTICPADGLIAVDIDASDNYSSQLETSLSIDGGAPQTTLSIVVNNLEPGPHHLAVQVRDDAGNAACDTVEVFSGQHPEVKDLMVAPVLFSPVNQTGASISSEISFKTTMPVDFVSEIRSFATGEIVSTTAGSVDRDEVVFLAWNGRDSLGGLLPDGAFGVNVHLLDSCGGTAEATVPDQGEGLNKAIEIDATPPTVLIGQPLAGAVLGAVGEVHAQVEDKNLGLWTIQVRGEADCEECWTEVAEGTTSISSQNDLLGVWDTSDSNAGQYFLRIVAVDGAGNQTVTDELPVTVRERGLVASFEATPSMVSPNGDGQLDFVDLRFSLIQDAVVSLHIVDAQGGLVRTFHDQGLLIGGPESWFGISWFGDDDLGLLVESGLYSLVLTAGDPAEPQVLPTEIEILTIEIDVTPPTVVIHQPAEDSISNLPAQVVVTADDLNPESYELNIFGSAGFFRTLKVGSGAIEAAAIAVLDGLPDGQFEVLLKATDQAENSAEVSHHFVVDSLAPRITLLSPQAGTVLNTLGGRIPLRAAIDEAHLLEFRWSVAPGVEPDDADFFDIAAGTVIPSGGVVEEAWDAAGLDDGPYTVRLLATDELGLTGAARVPIVIDNTLPDVSINLPTDGMTLVEPTEIQVQISDATLVHWIVDLSTEFGEFTTIAEGHQAVNGSVVSWDPLPVDGLYRLRLFAEDAAGNQNQTEVEVTIAATLPSSPIDLIATANGRDVALVWSPGPGQQPEGFNVYRDLEFLTAVDTPGFLDPSLEDGGYIYVVRSFDLAGRESTDSNAAAVAINLTPPIVNLSMPQDLARVSGDVTVFGTAYRETGFREFQLFVRERPSGLAIELNRGTTAVLADRVGQWNVLSSQVPDGEYELLLQAEDIYGNTASDTVEITLDNTAPSAPLLIDAIQSAQDPDGIINDVQISWQFDDPPPDISGYFVYRNGRLANGPEVVIGPQDSYLLPGMIYDDKDLSDGRYTYVVTAADLAGNESADSNPSAEIVIDTRRPHALIETPVDGAEVGLVTEVIASTPDQDVVSLQLQYRQTGSGPWLAFGPSFSVPPFAATFVAPSLGEYELRAVAADSHGADPSPQPSSVTVTVPAPKPTASVVGGSVTLTWQTVEEPSLLQGIHILRDDQPLTIVPLPPETDSYVDEGLADGTYRYTLVVVDQLDHEIAPSEEASATVYSVHLHWTDPIQTNGSTNVSGWGGLENGSIEIQRSSPVGDFEVIATVLASTSGGYSADLEIESGLSVLRAVGTGPTGDRSKPSGEVSLVVSTEPATPTDLVAAVDGSDVSLTWSAEENSESSGFEITRDGEGIGETVAAHVFDSLTHELFASDGTDDTWALAVDGDPQTGWAAAVQPGGEVPAFWQWTWPIPIEGSSLDVIWSEDVDAVSFDLDLRVNDSWFWWYSTSNSSWTTPSWSLPAGLEISGIRLRMNGPSWCVGVGQCSPPLQEVSVESISRTSEASYLDSAVLDGVYQYAVEALSSWGLASSEASALALVGVSTPAVPGNLVATAGPTCDQISLNWVIPNPAPESALSFAIYRAEFQGGPYQIVTMVPSSVSNLIDGDLLTDQTYWYVVRTVAELEGVRVEGENSNEASAIAECASPEPPVILAPTASGQPISLASGTTTIAGTGRSLTTVRLVHDGVEVAETTSSPALRDEFSVGLAGSSGGFSSVSIADDGRTVAYVSEGETQGIVVLDLESGRQFQLHSESGALGQPALSKDGSQMAFVVSEGDSDQIWLHDRASGTEQPLTEGPVERFRPVFSPVGDSVAYVEYSPDSGSFTIEMTNLMTGITDAVFGPTSDDLNELVFSPDGNALLVETWPGGDRSIVLIDLLGGGSQALPLTFDDVLTVSPFSPDSHDLVFSRMPDGDSSAATLWRYRISEGTFEALSQEGGDFSPVFIDNDRVAYLKEISEDTMQLRVRDASGTVKTLDDALEQISGPGFHTSLDASGRGWVARLTEGQVHFFLREQGTFIFHDVPLNMGANVFSARQFAQGQSNTSESIQIAVAPETMPDAVAVNLQAFPAYPLLGEQTLIRGTVGNQGGVPIENCPVSMWRVFADGTNEIVSTRLVTLEPGDTATLEFQWAGSEATGDAHWILGVDPDEIIPESDESNNTHTLTVPIRESDGIEASVAMNRGTYAPTSVATISVDLLATGLAQDYELTLAVEDEAGVRIAVIDSRTLQGFGQGTITFDVSWPLPNLVVGSYQVILEAAVSGAVAASAMASFDVVVPGNLVADVSTDRTSYSLSSVVSIVGTLSNPSAVSRSGLDGTLTIESNDGATIVAIHQVSLPTIPSNGAINVPWPWRADGVPVGVYRVGFSATDASANEVARSGWFQFALTEGPPVLSGSVSVSPVRLEPFGDVVATAEVRNAGAGSIQDLPISLALVEPGSWVVLDTAEGLVNIPSGESIHFESTLSVDGLELGQYLVLLLEGNTGSQQLASVALTLADLTPPELELIPPLSEATCGEATFAVHARDALTGVFAVHYTADGGTQMYPMFMQPEAVGGDVYSATWTFLPEQEGTHQIVIGASDIAGNQSPGLQFDVTSVIDELPPVVVISGVPTSTCGNDSVTPVIDATDSNLVSVISTLNGEPYIEGTVIILEGSYTLVVTARDGCGNETVETASFSIDTGSPVIEIHGVVEGDCLIGPLAIGFMATDANLERVSATLNGEPFIDGGVVEDDGVYSLVVTADDTCGNQTTESLTFALDNELPEIAVRGVEDGDCTNQVVTLEFGVSDDHLVEASATLNDEPFVSGTDVVEEGIYDLVVTAVEECGRITIEARTFVIDLAPPFVEISGIPTGACSNTPVTPDIVATDANLTSVVVTLNGEPFVPGTTLVDESNYALVVTAMDACGNETVRAVLFSIETGPPVIQIRGVEQGDCLVGPVVIGFGATDANLAEVTATLNGVPFDDGGVVETDGAYTLVVDASDSCGNRASETLTFTLDNEVPVITVEGVEDGTCTNEAVAFSFTAADDQLAYVWATLNDEPYVSGTEVSGEGAYTLAVTATELCGRETVETRSFIIDMTLPDIIVTGVEDGQTSPDALTIDWVATDFNPVTVEALLDGVVVIPPISVDAVGDHVLEISAIDCAGNEASETVAFTIGSQGPPPLIGILTVSPVIAENGQSVTLEAVVSNDGESWVDDIRVEIVVVPEAGGDPVARFESVISLGPDQSGSVVEISSTYGLPPGFYRVNLGASGTFFGEDYELELDQGAFEVLQIVAIPDLSPEGSLVLILLILMGGMWLMRRPR